MAKRPYHPRILICTYIYTNGRLYFEKCLHFAMLIIALSCYYAQGALHPHVAQNLKWLPRGDLISKIQRHTPFFLANFCGHWSSGSGHQSALCGIILQHQLGELPYLHCWPWRRKWLTLDNCFALCSFCRDLWLLSSILGRVAIHKLWSPIHFNPKIDLFIFVFRVALERWNPPLSGWLLICVFYRAHFGLQLTSRCCFPKGHFASSDALLAVLQTNVSLFWLRSPTCRSALQLQWWVCYVAFHSSLTWFRLLWARFTTMSFCGHQSDQPCPWQFDIPRGSFWAPHCRPHRFEVDRSCLAPLKSDVGPCATSGKHAKVQPNQHKSPTLKQQFVILTGIWISSHFTELLDIFYF